MSQPRSSTRRSMGYHCLTALLAGSLIAGAGTLGAQGTELEGSLAVTSEPAGAAVFVDGRDMGVTPIQLGGLAAGDHAVRVTLAGFLDNTRVVKIEAGRDQSLSVRLMAAGAAGSAAQPATAKKGGGKGKVALIALGAAAVGGGVYLALPKNKAPVAGTIGVSPTGTGLMAATEFSFSAQGASDANNDPLTYTWDFGDGASDSGQAVSHVYQSAGTFNVVLSVSDGKAKSQAPTSSITVKSLTGNWFFTEPSYGSYFDMEFSLTQTGKSLSGTRRYTDSSYTYSVTGSVANPRSVTFTLWGTSRGTASADLNTIEGTDGYGDAFRMTRR